MDITMVYDLETVPDVTLGRKLLDLSESSTSDEEVAKALIERRKEQTQGNSEFLPHYLHRIVAISVVVNSHDRVKVWSLGEPNSSEKELIERFYAGLDRFTPVLVSWNGSGFDLPVLHYRALMHGVVAKQYWETGESNPQFKWNNYLSRYHQRHTDLMDVLAAYQRASAPLNEIALMLGLPGKMGMSGGQVWDKFLKGDLETIRNYCETDVLNTYIVYLKFQFMRGQISESELQQEIERLSESLKTSSKPHLIEFLEAWQH